MADLFLVVLVIVISIAGLVIGWKLIGFLVKGFSLLFRKASDVGFIGLMLLVIAGAVAFPVLIVVAVYLGWRDQASENPADLGEMLGLNIVGLEKRVQLEEFKPYEMSCGAKFTVSEPRKWFVLRQNKAFSASLGFYSHDFYYIFNEKKFLQNGEMFFQVIRREIDKRAVSILELLGSDAAIYCAHVKTEDGTILRPEFGVCSWMNGLGVTPQGWFSYSNIAGPEKKNHIKEGFLIHSDSGYIYTIVLADTSTLADDEILNLKRTMEEVVRSISA